MHPIINLDGWGARCTNIEADGLNVRKSIVGGGGDKLGFGLGMNLTSNPNQSECGLANSTPTTAELVGLGYKKN